jgi:hypothetical protein
MGAHANRTIKDVDCSDTCYTNMDMSGPMKFFRVRR